MSKKALFQSLGITSLFHTEQTNGKLSAHLFMAPIDWESMTVDYDNMPTDGRWRLKTVRQGRTARTRAFLKDRHGFYKALIMERDRLSRKATEQGLQVEFFLPDFVERG